MPFKPFLETWQLWILKMLTWFRRLNKKNYFFINLDYSCSFRKRREAITIPRLSEICSLETWVFIPVLFVSKSYSFNLFTLSFFHSLFSVSEHLLSPFCVPGIVLGIGLVKWVRLILVPSKMESLALFLPLSAPKKMDRIHGAGIYQERYVVACRLGKRPEFEVSLNWWWASHFFPSGIPRPGLKATQNLEVSIFKERKWSRRSPLVLAWRVEKGLL